MMQQERRPAQTMLRVRVLGFITVIIHIGRFVLLIIAPALYAAYIMRAILAVATPCLKIFFSGSESNI